MPGFNGLLNSVSLARFVEQAIFGSRALVGATLQHLGGSLEREDIFRELYSVLTAF